MFFFFHRSTQPLFFLLAFLFFTSSSSSSPTPTLTPHLQPLPFPGTAVEVENDLVLPLETRRLLQDDYSNSTLILAANRTQRRDPLDDFKPYTGGFNISQKHYWASVGLTAAPFFGIAGVWFALFGITLACICICRCCCPSEPYGYSRVCYALSLIMLILFTVSTIIGCIVLYTGQQKFHTVTTHTLGYVVNQANVTAETLNNVSDYLVAAKDASVESIFLPTNIRNNIADIETKISTSSDTLSNRTEQNSRDIRNGLDSMRLALIILAAVMLALTFLGFLFSILGMQCVVYCLVILGWILVAGTFILCGVFLLVHNVFADSCVAMDEWVLNPTAKTAMDDIIPCVDNATAQATFMQAKIVTFQLVSVVDSIISNLSNVNLPPEIGPPMYFNQSGPLVPLLCNPFNPDYTERKCLAGEVDIENAPVAWKNYTCEVSPTGICTTPGRMTPTLYNQMSSAVNLSYGLHHYSPFLINLQDCTFVRETLTVINHTYCPDLMKFSEWIYIGLVMVSAAVMLSLIFWVIYARERRHRVYTKQFMSRGMEGEEKSAP
ncbi:uncharacterized protein [Euphorbia lathyris]|uniref:uncharacterized protein n=1 Tax=Euphorbia lathyris TaxID=212925 RepID=UPI003313FA85